MDEKDLERLQIKPVLRPIETVKVFDKKLNMSLCVPSVSHSFSLCVQYAKTWFKRAFAPTYFKTEFISGAHILEDFRKKDPHSLIKVQKPALAIVPELDPSFDRDGVDQYLFGTNTYYNNCRYQDAFFKDMSKKTFISIAMELLLVKFTYKVKVSSKQHAIDLARFIRQRFFCGATKGERFDMDFNVPTEMMLRVARDGGFEIKDGKVLEMNGFIQYLNSHSALPFMYKFNPAKGHFDYYMKLPDQYIHTRTNPVEMDDGEREGQLDNNYIVSFDTEVRFPCPKFYAYYSVDKKDMIKEQKMDGTYSIYDLCLCSVPVVNEKGWPQYISWDYLEDDDVFSKKEVSKIDIREILDSIANGAFKQIVEDVKGRYLSPSLFTEIRLYNDNKEADIDIDWENYIIKSKNVFTSATSHLVLYVNLQYLNEYKITEKEYIKNRMNQTKPIFPPEQ